MRNKVLVKLWKVEVDEYIELLLSASKRDDNKTKQ